MIVLKQKLIKLVTCCLLIVTSAHAPANANDAKVLEWEDLIPPLERFVLRNPPDSISNIVDGTPEDKIANKLKMNTVENKSAYQQALVSTNAVEEFQGEKVRIAGFIVPLEFGDDETVVSFFLVPYFGACVHLPPPPPNQIIYVESVKGVKWSFDPIWILGEINVLKIENEVAVSTYSITDASVKEYYTHK